MKIPPFHWYRTVFFLIPAIAVYTIVLGTLSILSTFVDRKGHAAHWCARAWSWLILATTGVDVECQGARARHARRDVHLHFESSEHLRHSGYFRVAAVSVAHHCERITRALSVSRLASDSRGASARRSPQPDRSAILNRWRRLVGDRLSLIIFPRVHAARRQVGRFKGGSFLLALEAGLTIVPLSVSGTQHVMKKGRLMTCPGRVTLPCTRRSRAPGSSRLRRRCARLAMGVEGRGHAPAASNKWGQTLFLRNS